MELTELDYSLPSELIAQSPLEQRDQSRLLVVGRDDGALAHRRFSELASLLSPSLFVLNNTRVFPARLRGAKRTGGKAELLLLETLRAEAAGTRQLWLALGRASKGLPGGTVITLGAGFTATIQEQRDGGRFEVLLECASGVDGAIATHGEVPLPPYIRRQPTSHDSERYQTVFASETGAVAAPTAGLHFTAETLGSLRAAGHRLTEVTLHVGPGTFRPVSSQTLADHPMHHERFVIGEQAAADIARARAQKTPVVAVGTTVVRTLEAAAAEDGVVRPQEMSTNLFIYPPFEFRVVDSLLTNFHLPRSTLLALVMAFSTPETIRRAYAEAVRERYRFFSYGDAMLIRSGR